MALDSYLLQNVDPLQSYLQGAQGIQQLQDNQQVMQQRQAAFDIAAQDREAKQQAAQLAAEQAQAEALQKQEMQVAMYSEPDRFKRANMMAQYQTRYKDDVAAITAAAKTMNDAERADLQGTSSKLSSAVAIGNIPLGLSVLENKLKEAENSGASQDRIDSIKYHLGIYKSDPMAAILGLEQAARAIDPSTFDANNKVGVDIKKTEQEIEGLKVLQPLEADRTVAQTEQATSTTRKNYFDIQDQKEKNQIERLRLLQAQSKDDLERQKLQVEIDTKESDLSAKKSERAGAGRQLISGFVEMKNKAMELLKDPQLDSIVGSVQGRTPNLTEASAATQAKLETLKSGIFLSVSPSLAGTQTAQDAIDMKNAFAALDPRMGEKAFKAELRKLITQMSAKEKIAREQFGQPDTSGRAGGGVIKNAPAFDIKTTSYGAFLGGK